MLDPDRQGPSADSPLSPPVEREHIHTRRFTVEGHLRADGLWDIEGHMSDVKTYAFHNHDRGEIQAGEPIHDMWIRLTLDDGYVVRAIEAVTAAGPFSICPAIAPNLQRMVGERIGPGWRKAVRDKLGGVEGCTHLSEMLVNMGTPAFQTIAPKRSRPDTHAAAEGAKRPALIGTCHAFSPDGPVVARLWPDFAEPPAGAAGSRDDAA